LATTAHNAPQRSLLQWQYWRDKSSCLFWQWIR